MKLCHVKRDHHNVRSDSEEDHRRALNADIDDPPKEWRRLRGRTRQTWLRAIENNLKQQNLRLWSARHRAYMTVNCGVKSWKQQRSSKGKLHDDDADDDDDDHDVIMM